MLHIKIIFILLIAGYNVSAQKINFLTEDEYNNILINDTNWRAIQNTNGDPEKMIGLLEEDLIYSYKDDPNLAISYGIVNKGLVFYFEDISESGDYQLTNIAIYRSPFSITLRGIELTIGDSVVGIKNSIAPPVIEISDGDKNILAFGLPNHSEAFYIDYDPETNLISQISFNSYN